MAVAKCGGLKIDDTSLTIVGNIITPVATTEPTGFIETNCGGVRFCSDDFKMVNNVITHKDATDTDVKPIKVAQQGCGGLVVDSTYFSLTENGELQYTPPTEDGGDEEEEVQVDEETE